MCYAGMCWVEFMKRIRSILIRVWASYKKLSRKKKALIIGVSIVILLVIFSQIRNAVTKKNGYILEKVKKDTITETVSETGTIIAGGQANVYSMTRGIVKEVYVNNGNSVKKGDKLFVVQSTASDQERNVAASNYLTAQSTLSTAEAAANLYRADMYTKWKTFRDMATNSTYADDDENPKPENRTAAEFQSTQDLWLAAEKKYKDSQLAVNAAAASVASTRALYEATQNSTILAPIDGIIANVAVTVGESVDPQIASTGVLGSPVLIVVNSSVMELKIPLGQTDIAKVKPYQEVLIEPDAYKGATYSGIVRRVDDVGINSAGVIKYNAYVEVTDADTKLKSGMTADAKIFTNKLTDVLSVSNAAVKPYKEGKAVRIIGKEKKKEPEYIPVVIGIKGDKRTQILSGLTDGQEIIVSLTNEQIKRSGMFGF